MSATDVQQLATLALEQFGNDWHEDNVTYEWIHTKWSQSKKTNEAKKEMEGPEEAIGE